MVDPKHLADAYLHVAAVNHYLVTVNLDRVTWDNLCDAEQILNRLEFDNPEDTVIRIALDICEHDLRRAQSGALILLTEGN